MLKEIYHIDTYSWCFYFSNYDYYAENESCKKFESCCKIDELFWR